MTSTERIVANFVRMSGQEVKARYWSPASEQFAGGDQLMRLLSEGWQPEKYVETEKHWYGEARHIVLYHMVLHRGGEQVVMTAIGGPFVNQMIQDERLGLELVKYDGPQRELRFTVAVRE